MKFGGESLSVYQCTIKADLGLTNSISLYLKTRTKKEKEEKKRKKEESTSFDPKFQQALRVKDKKRDDVEVEGQGSLFDDEQELNDDSKPVYAGHVIAVVERQAGQLFAGTLGILRPSSAATKEKQGEYRLEN